MAVGIAFAEQGGCFGGRNASDFQQEIGDDGGSVNRSPAPRSTEGEDEKTGPDDGFEKIVGMARVFPKSDSADGFRIGAG